MHKVVTSITVILVFFSSVLGQRREELPNLEDTKVTVPWSELKKLIEAGLKVDTTGVRPPVDASISSASYKATIKENSVSIIATCDITSLSKGWVVLPLLHIRGYGNSIGVRQVILNGKIADVFTTGGWLQLLLSGAGKHKLIISYAVKVPSNMPKQRVSVPLVKSSVSLFTLYIQKPGFSMTIEPSLFNEKNGKNVLTAIIPECDAISISWEKTMPLLERPKPIVYADVSTLISVGEGVLSGSTSISYSILQSTVSSFQFLISKDVKLLDVQGGEFKVLESGEFQTVTVNPLSEVSGSHAIEIFYEKTLGKTSAETGIPYVMVQNVERERGFVGIEARTNVEVKTTGIGGSIESMDVKELPESVWEKTVNPILLAFKYLKHPFSLNIDIVKHEGLPVLVAMVDQANFTTLFTDDGKSITRGIYQVRNNLQQFIKIGLPEETEVWSSFVSGKPVKPTKGEKKNEILIQLERSRGGDEGMRSFPVELVYFTKGKKFEKGGKLDVSLPKTDIPVSELFWSCWLPDEYKYSDFGGNVKEWKGEIPKVPVYQAQIAAPMKNGWRGNKTSG